MLVTKMGKTVTHISYLFQASVNNIDKTKNLGDLKLHRCCSTQMLLYIDVGDKWKLVTIFGTLMLKDRGSWSTKSAKTVTNISKLSQTYFVSDIRHQHRSSRDLTLILILTLRNCIGNTLTNIFHIEKLKLLKLFEVFSF